MNLCEGDFDKACNCVDVALINVISLLTHVISKLIYVISLLIIYVISLLIIHVISIYVDTCDILVNTCACDICADTCDIIVNYTCDVYIR